MLNARSNCAVVALAGEIYVCGGAAPGPERGTVTHIYDVEKYDPATYQWIQLEAIPLADITYEGVEPHFWHAAVSYNGRIYVFSDPGFEAMKDALRGHPHLFYFYDDDDNEDSVFEESCIEAHCYIPEEDRWATLSPLWSEGVEGSRRV